MQWPSLTFVHGFMGHSSDWDEIRRQLEDRVENVETFAVSMRPAACWNESIQQLADQLPAKSVLVGYSMGARLALGVALDCPERVEGLIFISGNPGLESDETRQQRRERDEALATEIEELYQSGGLPEFLERWYQQSVFAATDSDVRREEVRRKLASDPKLWPAVLRTNSIALQPNYWPRLSELKMRSLVVAGQDDEKYAKIAVRFAEEIGVPGSEAKIIAHCGHIVHREQPALLAEVIRGFVGDQ